MSGNKNRPGEQSQTQNPMQPPRAGQIPAEQPEEEEEEESGQRREEESEESPGVKQDQGQGQDRNSKQGGQDRNT